MSTDNSINWVPGWQPFHTNLLVFPSQADFQLNSLTNQLLHVTSLNWTADNWLKLGWCPSYITSGQIHQKTAPPTILPLLSWKLPSDRLEIVSTRMRLPTFTKQCIVPSYDHCILHITVFFVEHKAITWRRCYWTLMLYLTIWTWPQFLYYWHKIFWAESLCNSKVGSMRHVQNSI
jgi:hypothetical protein